uniref:Ovule protein n=1 Tax=Heterorhabditis bacteriophora TaxID=37862 RepID=A0A1I7WET4_HETBA
MCVLIHPMICRRNMAKTVSIHNQLRIWKFIRQHKTMSEESRSGLTICKIYSSGHQH